jgi:O-antigen/teichoic acid export membrane protein
LTEVEYIKMNNEHIFLKQKKSLSNVIFGEISKKILNLISLVVLARLITPGEFGLIELALVYTSFFTFLSDLGLSTAIIQRSNTSKVQLNTIYVINIAVGILLYLLVYTLSFNLSHLHDNADLERVVSILGLVFIVQSFKLVHYALLRKSHNFKSIQYSQVISIFISLVVGILLAYFNHGYWSLVAMILIQNIIETLLMIHFSKWRFSFDLDFSKTRSHLSFGYNLSIASLANYFSKKIDKVIIADAGIVEVGLYSKAYKIMTMILPVIRATVIQVGISTICALDDHKNKALVYKKIVLSASLIMYPIGVLITTNAELLVDILLGGQWSEIVEYIKVFGYMLFLQPLLATRGVVFIGYNKSKEYMYSNIVYSGVTVIAMLTGYYFYNVMGVVASYVLINYLIVIPLLIYTYKNTTIKLFASLRMLRSGIVGGVIMSLFGLILHIFSDLLFFNNVIIDLLSVFLQFSIYLAVIILFKDSRKQVKSLFNIIIYKFRD